MHPAPNRRVLVTRAAHQASELATRLVELGLEPILIPAIETVEPTSWGAFDYAIAHLDTFDWLLFTSANAVEAFVRRRPSQTSELTCKVAVIGPTTARAAERAGLHFHLTPPQAVAESLTEALLPHARQPNGSPTRFLLVRAEEAREHLPETLRAAGAEITVAPVYRTVIPGDSVAQLRAALTDPSRQLAAITFTSSSTARNLLSLCEAASVSLPASALRISIGPITTQTLRELGIPPHAESPEATVDAIAQATSHILMARNAQ